ncbi:MAG: aminotransferase class I/II-fold pyridoxal phosphate-dependent enzyme [Clostridia bacterium]|nr:aminotransferase class I/II-fold pyridoxal phosphate-dependent enzyme [Clostridia bacterium]
MNFSDKFGNIKENILVELDTKSKEMISRGEEVINLSIGTPDIPPADFVIKAVSDAFLKAENYKYGITESSELLDAVVYWYKNRYNVELEHKNIAAVNGSQEGIAHIAFPLCNKGDIVLVPDPCYQIFSFGPTMADVELYYMPLLKENDYIIDLKAIPENVAMKAKMMIVSYPNNPTTATAPVEFYKGLVEFAKKYDIIVIHDNAYSELIYDDEPGISFLEIDGAMDVGIEFNSLSKSYNLTGMRLSFAVGNAEIIKRFKAFRSQIDYGMCMGIQTGAIAALTGDQGYVEEVRNEYRKRRDTLIEGLNSIGWNVPKTRSTMFAWLPIPPKFKSSLDFSIELLEKTGVLVVPGVSFGKLGEGYVRAALVQDCGKLKRAVDKIEKSGILK